MGDSSEHNKYVAISYATTIFAICAFATYAVVYYTIRLVKRKKDQTTEEFITARNTMPRWRIAWSFFAGAVGAWVITAPPSFAVYTGIIGLLMYALASGFPVLIIAFFGDIIRNRYPNVCSLGDYIGFRFGPVLKTTVVVIVLFNMSIAMLAEYTTIAALFRDFVGTLDYPIVIVVGILTMVYTAYGGLRISIVTDQAQGILTVLLVAVLTIYVAVTFREPLPKPIPDYLGPNKEGYSAIFSMPCALMAATVFSEAVWQKAWAAQDKKALIFGGAVGFVMITVVVFLAGFGGLLAAWGGLIDPFVTNGNLFLFQVFAAEQGDVALGASAQVRSWVGVVTLILACTMNESAIDSLQNGLTAALSNHFFKGQNTIFARLIVLFINIPLMIISLQGYNVLQLFLVTNMLTTCWFIPISLGLIKQTQGIITESSVIFGGCVAILTACAYGIGDNWTTKRDPYALDPKVENPFDYGTWWAWYGDAYYYWDYFLVTASFSIIGMLMWIVPAQIIKRLTGWEGPGITGVLKGLPGFGVITGQGFERDLLTLPGLAPLGRLLGRTPYEQSDGAMVVEAKGAKDEDFKSASAVPV